MITHVTRSPWILFPFRRCRCAPPPTKTAAGESEEQIKSVRDRLWKCLSWKETRKAAAPPHGRGFGPRRVRPLLAGSSETRDPGFRRCKLGCSGWPRSRRNPDFRGRRGLQIARLARWTGRKRAREPNRNQTACEVGKKARAGFRRPRWRQQQQQQYPALSLAAKYAFGRLVCTVLLPWHGPEQAWDATWRVCAADIVAKSAHQARGS